MSLRDLHEQEKAKNMYLTELGKAEKITILQFQKLLHPDVEVYIKPSNHKLYWRGQAMYIPKDMYDWKVKDLSLAKKGQVELFEHGSIALFVEENEKYEEIADKAELDEINSYYRKDTYIF